MCTDNNLIIKLNNILYCDLRECVNFDLNYYEIQIMTLIPLVF